MEQVISYLQPFSALKAAEIEALTGKLRPKELRRNDAFVTAGTTCYRIGFVIEGILKAVESDTHGDEATIYFNTPRWNPIVCDLGSIVTKGPARYTIRAIEPCNVVELLVHDLEALYEAHHGIERLGRKLAEHHYLQAMEKIHLADSTAEQKLRELLAKHPEILRQAKAKEVASYLGMTEATFSRERKKILRAKEVLSQDKS